MLFPSRLVLASTVFAGLSLFACGDEPGTSPPNDSAASSSGASSGGTGSSGNTGSGGLSSTSSGGPVPAAPPLECEAPGPGPVPNGVIPGELLFPSPTVHNASIVWRLDGDANDDAVVDLRFREDGRDTWRAGLPLRSVQPASMLGFSRVHEFAGSLFDLQPGTVYEVELRMQDADGGCEVRRGTFTTRAVPGVPADATIRPATPATLASVLAAAGPGDVVELAAGSYGGFSIEHDGSAARPLVVRGLPGAKVNGEIGLFGRAHVRIEGLEIDGRIRANASHDVAIVRNRIRATEAFEGHGIVAYARPENLYIADNEIVGLTTWRDSALANEGDNLGEGILVTGPGHVIEHNRVRGFRDCLSTLEGNEAEDQHSIDFVENDLSVCADDGIEADFCLHGCRSIRNRISNAFIAMSSQPGIGGPNFFVRNVVSNAVLHAFKPLRGSVGDVYLHNTVVKSGDAFSVSTDLEHPRQLSRGNLFLGGPGGTFGGYPNGDGAVLMLPMAGGSNDFDYDGFGSADGSFRGRFGDARFESLAQLHERTSEKHAIQIDTSVFAAAISVPSGALPAVEPFDLQLAPGGAAIDRGVVLPNVNDGFSGSAPDLGAYELGQGVPVYGPR